MKEKQDKIQYVPSFGCPVYHRRVCREEREERLKKLKAAAEAAKPAIASSVPTKPATSVEPKKACARMSNPD